MGCGESKQAVATENTLTKTKSKTKNSLPNNPPIENSTNDENLKENGIIDAIKEETKGKENENENENENSSKKTENEKEKEIEKVEAVVVVEENKGEAKNEELKGEKERVISNDSPPDNLSSPKKETIESVISEGVSGKSDDDSTRAKDNVSDAEGKEKEIEANSNKEKDDDLKVDEGKELAPADETKSSGEEEKTSAAKTENANAAPTDAKEN